MQNAQFQLASPYSIPQAELVPLPHSCEALLLKFSDIVPHETHSEPIACEGDKEMWKITTSERSICLRKYKGVGIKQTFANTLAIARIASQFHIGPTVYGWNESQKALLMQYIHVEKRPIHTKDLTPYQCAMKQLRRLHEAHENAQPAFCEWQSRFPWNVLFLNKETLELGFPPQLTNALMRLMILYKEIAPWLEHNAKLIQVDLSEDHVLHSREGREWQVHFVNFDHCVWGHPYWDVVNYGRSLPPHEQDTMLYYYLDTHRISARESWHFELCKATKTMHRALRAFRHAQKQILLADQGLSIANMEQVLNKKDISFLARNNLETSAQMSQAKGSLALSEVLSITEKLLPTGDCELIEKVLQRVPTPPSSTISSGSNYGREK